MKYNIMGIILISNIIKYIRYHFAHKFCFAYIFLPASLVLIVFSTQQGHTEMTENKDIIDAITGMKAADAIKIMVIPKGMLFRKRVDEITLARVSCHYVAIENIDEQIQNIINTVLENLNPRNFDSDHAMDLRIGIVFSKGPENIGNIFIDNDIGSDGVAAKLENIRFYIRNGISDYIRSFIDSDNFKENYRGTGGC